MGNYVGGWVGGVGGAEMSLANEGKVDDVSGWVSERAWGEE